MRGTRKLSEIINRGVTAAALTGAIAVIYAAMATDSRASGGEFLRHQMQTVFKLDPPELQIPRDRRTPQESVTALLLSYYDQIN
ncbi:MAG: hypothetical protein AAGI45_13795 [Cyanobacteria bacterium P01_H01_bin.26]